MTKRAPALLRKQMPDFYDPLCEAITMLTELHGDDTSTTIPEGELLGALMAAISAYEQKRFPEFNQPDLG